MVDRGTAGAAMSKIGEGGEQGKRLRRGANQRASHPTAAAHKQHAARGRQEKKGGKGGAGEETRSRPTGTPRVPTQRAPSTPTEEEEDRTRELPCEIKGSIFLPTSSSLPTRLARLLSPVEGHSGPRPPHAQPRADPRRSRAWARPPLRTGPLAPRASPIPPPFVTRPSPGPRPSLSRPSPDPLLAIHGARCATYASSVSDQLL